MNIPLELQEKTFSYLVREDLVPLRLVCLNWYRLIIPIIGKCLFLCHEGTPPEPLKLPIVYFDYCENLTVGTLNSEALEFISRLKNLKTLHLKLDDAKKREFARKGLANIPITVNKLIVSGSIDLNSLSCVLKAFGTKSHIDAGFSEAFTSLSGSEGLVDAFHKLSLEKSSLFATFLRKEGIFKHFSYTSSISKMECISARTGGVVSFSYDFHDNCFLSVGVAENSNVSLVCGLSPNAKDREGDHISKMVNFLSRYWSVKTLLSNLKEFYYIDNAKLDVTRCLETYDLSLLQDIKDLTIRSYDSSCLSLKGFFKTERLNLQISEDKSIELMRFISKSFRKLKYLYFSGTSKISPAGKQFPELLQVSSSIPRELSSGKHLSKSAQNFGSSPLATMPANSFS